MKYKHTKKELESVISRCFSIAQVCKELNIIPAGGNYKTIRNKINNWELDISHFTGQGWNTGNNFRQFGKSIKLVNILIENSTYTNTDRLRQRLIKEGFKKYECECCGLKNWLSRPISLELHHINGINNDHRIKNLKILCPNCHAITDNYRGRNIQSGDGTDIHKELKLPCL